MGFCSKRMRFEGVMCRNDGHADAARARPRSCFSFEIIVLVSQCSFPATPIVVDVDID